ncbi:MAG: carbohydrate ABC transporter permease, partial [Vallitalea sp.]|nr:carbohydrate ABC transporter permease [Vallitalea sp.]
MIVQKKKKDLLFQTANYLIFIVVSLICILPFVHMLAVSFSSSTAVSGGEVGLIPIGFNTQSYAFALSDGKFLRALMISIVRVVLGVGLNLILMCLTAYPLSRTKETLKGRNVYMTFFVITMFINGGLIPTYMVIVKLGLINSIWALILPFGVSVYNMIILMNFMKTIPIEIEESARIDGASPFLILIKIILPLMKPALATVGLFCLVWHWNDWFHGIVYLGNPKDYPLQSYLQTLLNSFDQILRNSGGDYQELLAKVNVRTGRAS